MNDNDELLRAARQVARAISDPGVNPAYHRQQVNNLSINWPTMYRAVNNLVTVLAHRKSPEGATSAPHGQEAECQKGSDSLGAIEAVHRARRERDAARADVERLVAERDAARAEAGRLTSKLDAARAEVDRVEAERILCDLAGPRAGAGQYRFRLRSVTSNDALIDALNCILDEQGDES